MKMRLVKGVWYSAFKYKGRYIGRTLKAKANQLRLAERNLSALVEQLERGENDKQGFVVFKDLVFTFRGSVLPGKEPSYQSRVGVCLGHLLSYFGRFRVASDINAATIVQYRRFREARKVKGATIRKELYVLKSVVNLVDEDFKLPSFKRADMQFSNKSKKITRRLTYDEAMKIIHAADAWLKPIIIVGLFTGLRFSNVLGLKWESVDLAKKTIWIKGTKNGEDVMVPMSRMVFDALSYLRGVSASGVDLVFLHSSVDSTFKVRVQRACQRVHASLGLDWLRPFHDYRHFFCHYLINEGKADFVLVSKLAGHKNPSMTSIYASPSLELKQGAIATFDQQKDSFIERLKGIIAALGTGVNG